MRVRQQSTATYHIPIYMVLSSDHVSVATGKTVSVTLSKNGAAFGAASGAITEVSSGVYKLAANATDTDTLGSLVVLATATGCDPYLVEYTIVPYNPFDSVRLGLTALPNAAAEASGGLYTRGTGAGQINQPANGQIDANAVKLGGTTQTGRDIGASVLISSGTGTGQLDVTSGVIKANLAQILGTALTETAGQIAAAFKQFFDVASPTGTMKAITAVTTVTNLTNAPTAGDFTSTMKTSLNAATPASVTGAVGSVTGNVGGNVVGSVASVTAGVTVTTNNDKTGYTASTVTDKTGYALSAAGVQAIWDALTSALTTVGSVGKRIADNLDAAITSRMATFSYTTPLNSTQTAQAILDATAASYNTAGSIGEKINSASAPSAATVADAVWDEAISGHLTAGTTGNKLNAASAAGDPWSTDLPGSYTGNNAGAILPAIKAKTDTLSSGNITVTSPVVDDQTISIVKGDDYKNADGRALFASTTFSNAPSLTGATVRLKVKNGTTPFSKTGTVTGAAALYVELTTTETAAFSAESYQFDLEAELSNGDIVTIAQGQFEVAKDVR